MAERRSLMVKSGITKGVCSTVVLADAAFVDILSEVAGEKRGRVSAETSKEPRRSRDSRGREEEREAGTRGGIAEFLWGNR